MRRLIALVSLLLLIGVEVASARFAVILPRDKGDYDKGCSWVDAEELPDRFPSENTFEFETA